MADTLNQTLLVLLLDSWQRNNAILVNLLRALPEGGLDARALEESSTVGELFTHIHYCRLIFVHENAPEFAKAPAYDEWNAERDPEIIAGMLNKSADTVRVAVMDRIDSGREMDVHYDHPILMLQHMIWHEGYHHGQIKLALMAAGRPFDDEEIGAVTWDLWMEKGLWKNGS